MSCPYCGNDQDRNFLGVEISEHYDGVLYWVCQGGCGRAWNRWSQEETPRRWRLAETYVMAANLGIPETDHPSAG